MVFFDNIIDEIINVHTLFFQTSKIGSISKDKLNL